MKPSFILCVTLLLCGPLFAQSTTRRLFVGIDGPVKSVRLEVADFIKNADSVIEAPRILTNTMEANQDGSLAIAKHYKPDGTVDFKQVTSYNPDGRAKESLVYSSEERLATRMLYYYGSGRNRMETFHYRIDGSIASTSVTYLDDGLSLTKGETRDNRGALREEEVSKTDASGLSEQTHTSYTESGKVSGKVVTVTLSARQHEERFYDADGVLKSKIVTTVDQKGEWVERATYDGERKLRKKESWEREYDARGNWIKQVTSKWNPQTEKSEPTQVRYRSITYYEN